MNDLKHRAAKLLRSTERYTKTDMVYLTKNGSWLTLGQFAASGGALILSILFANLLTKDTYGTYKYVLALVSLLSITTLAGINTSLVQGVARGSEGSFLKSLRVKMVWGMLGLGAAVIAAGYYFLAENATLAWALLLSAPFVPLMDPLSLHNTYLQGKKLFRQSIVYYTISQVIATLAVAAAVFSTRDLYVILAAYFLSWTLARYFFHRRTLKHFPPNDIHDESVILYGKHLTFVGVLTNVAAYVDDLFIFHFLGAAPVAVYNLAAAPIEQVRALSKNLPTLAVPSLTQRSIPEINVLLYRRLAYLFLLGLGMALLYAAAAPYLFTWIFPKYHDAILISQLFAGTLALRLPTVFLGAVTQSKINLIPPSWLYWGSVPQAVLIASLLVLIPWYGLIGVLLSVYLQLAVGFGIGIVQWSMLSRRHA